MLTSAEKIVNVALSPREHSAVSAPGVMATHFPVYVSSHIVELLLGMICLYHKITYIFIHAKYLIQMWLNVIKLFHLSKINYSSTIIITGKRYF